MPASSPFSNVSNYSFLDRLFNTSILIGFTLWTINHYNKTPNNNNNNNIGNTILNRLLTALNPFKTLKGKVTLWLLLSLGCMFIVDLLFLIKAYANSTATGLIADSVANELSLSSAVFLCQALAGKTGALFLLLAHFNQLFGNNSLYQLSRPFFSSREYSIYIIYSIISLCLYTIYIILSLSINYNNLFTMNIIWFVIPFILHSIECMSILILLIITVRRMNYLLSTSMISKLSSFTIELIDFIRDKLKLLGILLLMDITGLFILSIGVLAPGHILHWTNTAASRTTIVVDILTKLFTIGYSGQFVVIMLILYRKSSHIASNNPVAATAASSTVNSNKQQQQQQHQSIPIKSKSKVAPVITIAGIDNNTNSSIQINQSIAAIPGIVDPASSADFNINTVN